MVQEAMGRREVRARGDEEENMQLKQKIERTQKLNEELERKLLESEATKQELERKLGAV